MIFFVIIMTYIFKKKIIIRRLFLKKKNIHKKRFWKIFWQKFSTPWKLPKQRNHLNSGNLHGILNSILTFFKCVFSKFSSTLYSTACCQKYFLTPYKGFPAIGTLVRKMYEKLLHHHLTLITY